MGKPIVTPVLDLLQTVRRNTNNATPHSWDRLNHAMQQALRLAIGAGFAFSADDFRALGELGPGRWMGEREHVYSLAIAEGNLSAAKAYEEWIGREPLIADDVTPATGHGFANLTGTRQQERLHVGCYFPWQGEKVRVTSFTEQGDAVACSYHPGTTDERGYTHGHESKIRRRYTITREAIIKERAERKERAGWLKKLTRLCEGEQGKTNRANEILIALGIKTREEFDRIPLAKLRRAAGKILAEVNNA